jgi:hypothetical protein
MFIFENEKVPSLLLNALMVKEPIGQKKKTIKRRKIGSKGRGNWERKP